jgi:hypothetical protein
LRGKTGSGDGQKGRSHVGTLRADPGYPPHRTGHHRGLHHCFGEPQKPASGSWLSRRRPRLPRQIDRDVITLTRSNSLISPSFPPGRVQPTLVELCRGACHRTRVMRSMTKVPQSPPTRHPRAPPATCSICTGRGDGNVVNDNVLGSTTDASTLPRDVEDPSCQSRASSGTSPSKPLSTRAMTARSLRFVSSR